MSALGTLSIFFIVILILVVIGVASLFIFKSQKAHNIIFILLAMLTIFISFLIAGSAPSNFMFEQIIAWAYGLMAIAALCIKFFAPQYAKYAKLLLAFAALVSMFDLFIA